MQNSTNKKFIILRIFFSALIIFSTGLLFAQEEKKAEEKKKESIFDVPQKQMIMQRLVLLSVAAGNKKDYRTMEKICIEGVKRFPKNPGMRYNLACALALQEINDLALTNLEQAIELGFTNVDHISKDTDLESLRKKTKFKSLLEKAEKLHAAAPRKINTKITALEPEDGVVSVTETNTAWNPRYGVFVANFKFPEKPAPALQATRGKNDVLDKIRTWYKNGTAAGNHGDLYDNRDKDHSNMAYRKFPLLTRVEYAQEAKKRKIDRGLAATVLFNSPTIGNASLAGHWSLPRLMVNNKRRIGLQYIKYMRNHLEVFPEHRDHDPASANKGKGKGDTFAANTPYYIVSQGSSGTDRPFLEAMVSTLAAFQPETKKILTKNGMLAPTLQMLFRYNQNCVKTPEDYLSGKAHPTVFSKEAINTMKMIKMAHEMKPDNVPPLANIQVIEEDQAVLGKDFFSFTRSQVLFNTPSAIARVMRSVNYSYRIVISAEKSRDINGKKLSYNWVVLRGDSDRIKIKKMNKEGSIAELIIPYHTREKTFSGSKIKSTRVDIGLFVNNGKYYSAPAFASFYFIDDEKRIYDKKKRIKSVDYVVNKNNYTDPMLVAEKNWRDEYIYNKAGTLTGWKRYRGKNVEEFNAKGELLSKDKLKPQKVKYIVQPLKNHKQTELKQVNDNLSRDF